MSPWNIAKSAEAVVSRFAGKRVCMFLLKKQLGRFVLGDINLDQLDVQLSAGIIRLTDLSLNVDHLNDKLGGSAPLKLREGSIGSLLVKMPWNCNSFQVEVDELELVLAPCDGGQLHRKAETCNSSEECCVRNDFEKHDVIHKSAAASIDVHEGVKAVANMVKWLLGSFHVKVKKVIVAFDPHLDKYEDKTESCKTLVLRIAEIECGTCISEDANSTGGLKSNDFLQINRLTNFLKFQGNLKLSIPWKNGSLDIRKVDADVYLDPVEVELQPRIIRWFLLLWKTLGNYEKNDDADLIYFNTTDSIFSSSDVMLNEKSIPNCGSFSMNSVSPFGGDEASDVLFEDSHLILDWVPFSIGKSPKDGIEEADLGASVDQFFECFDGIRSSQSMLGSSGMWNWTCSVFSAITAASNLASGSLHFPIEQQHVETNLRVNLSGVSLTFSLPDQEQMDLHGPTNDQIDIDSNIHFLRSRWQDILIVVQVCPQEWKLEAIVKNIDLIDYFSATELDDINNSVNNQTLVIQHLQDQVQGALPLRSFSTEDSSSEAPDTSAAEIPFSFLSAAEDCSSKIRCENKDVVKARLLKTFGASHFQFTMSSRSSNGCFTGPAYFSLQLPPLFFWANLNLLHMLFDLCGKTWSSVGINKAANNATSEAFASRENHGASVHGNMEGSLQGNILIPTARVIGCFPVKNDGGFQSYTSWNQFIAVDFSSTPDFMAEEARGSAFIREPTYLKKYSSSTSHSLHLKMAKIDVYLITMASKDDNIGSSTNPGMERFSTERVFSLTGRSGCLSVISMLWHESATTDASVMKTAKLLATSDDIGIKTNNVKKGYEFASATSRKDMEDLNSQIRKEVISSSKFLLHVSLCPVVITLGRPQFIGLFHFLNQMMDGFTCAAGDSSYESKIDYVGQTALLIECDSVEVEINLDVGVSTESSLQRELPGSWHKLKLNTQNFELLSVSHPGGLRNASFLSIGHGEGRLWGSTTGFPDHDLLLISCSNSSMGRGDGEGSNGLSCSTAGSDFVVLYDPESLHNFTSVTVKGVTIVAPGGRLDWMDRIFSFFSFPSDGTEEVTAISLQKDQSQDEVLSGASFVLVLIDGGLSYEPYLKKLIVSEASHVKSRCSASMEQETRGQCVASLLAASSLKLSNTTAVGSTDCDYNIRLQDLGLLLHIVSLPETHSDYSVGQLQKIGYVKVAAEALVEAVLKINLVNNLFWEFHCSESHIDLSTCHDTTLSLIQLVSQIQQLFAPDVEESIVHLQNRWNNIQQGQLRKIKGEYRIKNDYSPSSSEVKQANLDAQSKTELVGLMDKICEDAFLPGGNFMGNLGCSESEVGISLHGNEHGEGSNSSLEYPENVPSIFTQPFQVTGLEGQMTSILQKTDLIEGYCLSELRSLSELTLNNQFADEMHKSKSMNVGTEDVRGGNSRWYGNASLKIMENHISDNTDWTVSEQLVKGKFPSRACFKSNNSERFKGRVLLQNVNVKWRMYAGSDWNELGQTVQCSGDICGRDGTKCLEVVLSDMNIQYDIFPDGDICLSRLCLSIRDFYLYDKSRYAPWKLVLGYYHSKKHPRESSSKAFKLDLEAVRPDPVAPLEEYRLRIACLPVSLHLHQSQLDFLIAFFGGKFSSVDDSDPSSVALTGSNDFKACPITDEALLPFFQKFDMWPIVLRVDYLPSHVDLVALSGGKYVELVNLVPWKGVELQLKHVQGAGVYGWSSVCETIIGEWLEDISQNQIRKLLQGLPTIRSLVSVGSGAAKFVSLPVKNYRKDHRLMKGVQRGTIAFLKSISVEALGLGVHLAAGAHDILLHAECVLTPIQPSSPWPVQCEIKANVACDQPRDAQQGFQQACESLGNGLGKTAAALVHTPMKTYLRGGGAGPALVTAAKGAPAAVIAPASAAAQAVRCALVGVRNSLDPKHEESLNNYLGPSHSGEHS
ncbi:hypothetical protein Nepgr_015257 [Nepenthes gracilis]|uniref:Autophagy-related protein 2 n=1 Tax=Nepenthes gracilis TaxID=150966 RepID=A0AAD3SMX5_NEPGR|nr:hypothetical protein Nepgr_015257 [Nepenthes gracilis]